MKIKIISDGTNTKVVDSESGIVIPGVQVVSFHASVDDAPEAFLHLIGVQCEIVCDAKAGLELPDLHYKVEDLEILPEEIRSFFNDTTN